jgi:hypothetical protein
LIDGEVGVKICPHVLACDTCNAYHKATIDLGVEREFAAIRLLRPEIAAMNAKEWRKFIGILSGWMLRNERLSQNISAAEAFLILTKTKP